MGLSSLYAEIGRKLYAVKWCGSFNLLDSKGNYSATSDNTKLVHWSLMGGLLHLVQRRKDWAGITVWSVALRF